MSDIICVTNSRICKGDFLSRIEEIAACRPKAIILREKHLGGVDYARLAAQVMKRCEAYDVLCILHGFADEAVALGAECMHLPMPLLRTSEQKIQNFQAVGASVHAVEEAQEAERLGAAYLTAGHVFDTDCKKGLPGRGLEFLSAICRSVKLPVYAIGGITPETIHAVRDAGAAGACIMSGLMLSDNVSAYLKSFEECL